MDMGKKIFALRKQKGYTQEELGKIVGVGRAAINKYERGTVDDIGRGMIKKLAVALSTSPSYLVDDEMENPPAISGEGKDPLDARLDELLANADDDLKRLMVSFLERSQNK